MSISQQRGVKVTVKRYVVHHAPNQIGSPFWVEEDDGDTSIRVSAFCDNAWDARCWARDAGHRTERDIVVEDD